MKRLLFVLCVVLLGGQILAQPALGQAGNVRLVTDNLDNDETPDIQDADYPNITFNITPVNESGVPISALTPTDFTLREDGKPVDSFNVTQFEDSEQGISVLLVLDMSGSMRDNLDELRAAATELYNYLELQPDKDESALIAFSILEDGTTVDLSDPFPVINPLREVEFTYDTNLILNTITAIDIQQSDGTPLYDAVYKGARMATKARNTRRAVILMTDGVDEGRNGVKNQGSAIYDAGTVLEEIRNFGVPVFTIGLGDNIDSAFLQRVANATGGRYENTPNVAELGELFTSIASQLKQKYAITYQSNISPDDDLHSLNVSVDTPEGVGETVLSFKAFYPEDPQILQVNAALPRQEARGIGSFESVKGIVIIEPDVVARRPIAAVNYFVDGNLVFTANETPWTFRWNTRELTPNETHELLIEAIDDANTPHTGVRSFELLVEECSVICVLEQTVPVPPTYLLAALVFLLLLLIFYLGRRRRPAAAPVYQPAPATDPAMKPPFPILPSFETTPAPPLEPNPTIRIGGASGFGDPAQSRPSPKTEVLRKEPEEIAFLIDASTGRQFRLFAETTIGRDATNDVVLDDPAISGKHAKVRLEEKTFAIYDLATTNHTFVNDQAITRHVLHDGDRVSLGRKQLVFKRVQN